MRFGVLGFSPMFNRGVLQSGQDNRAPVVNNQSFSIAENSAIDTVVGTVVASDQDNDVLTYSIVAGNELEIFKINSTTGVISVNYPANLDFEYFTNDGITAFTEIVVRVSDGTLHTDATITINITNVGEIPAGARSQLSGLAAYGSGLKLVDISGNGNHAPATKSYATGFANASSYVDLVNVLSNVVISNGHTHIFEFGIGVSSLNQSNKDLIKIGDGVDSRGLRIRINNNTFVTNVRDDWGYQQSVVSNATIPDDGGLRKVLKITIVKFDYAGRAGNRIKIDYNGETQQVVTMTTQNDMTGPTAFLGGANVSANFTLSYFKKSTANTDGSNEVVSTFISFAQNHQTDNNFDVFDSASGSILSGRALSLLFDDTWAHNNLRNGFQLFVGNYASHNDGNYWYVPYKTDGTRIYPNASSNPTTTITYYKWVGDFPADDFLNFPETKFQISAGVEKTAAELATTPFKKYFAGTLNDAYVNNILVYDADQSEVEVNNALLYLGYERPLAKIKIGDSIISTGGSISDPTGSKISSLTGDLADPQPLAKIADYNSRSVQTLTPENSTQVHVEGMYSIVLSMALELGIEVWIAGVSESGSTLWYQYEPVDNAGVLLVKTKNTIDDLMQAMIRAHKYPHFEVVCSLGQNDSQWVEMSADFHDKMVALIAHLRAYVYQASMEFHFLCPRRLDANQQTIGAAYDAIAAADDNVYLYDPEVYFALGENIDNVHLNGAGEQHLGRDFANKNYSSFQ